MKDLYQNKSTSDVFTSFHFLIVCWQIVFRKLLVVDFTLYICRISNNNDHMISCNQYMLHLNFSEHFGYVLQMRPEMKTAI